MFLPTAGVSELGGVKVPSMAMPGVYVLKKAQTTNPKKLEKITVISKHAFSIFFLGEISAEDSHVAISKCGTFLIRGHLLADTSWVSFLNILIYV